MTITMHVLFSIELRLFLFFVLIATGASLMCEVCQSKSTTCSGKMEMCPAKTDVCLYAVVESTIGGNKSSNAIKTCGSIDMCSSPEVVLHMGNGTIYTTSVVCCKGRTCPDVSPQLPSKEVIPNGVVCPACYTSSGICENETVACVGSQEFCFDVSTLVTRDGKETAYIMRGCTMYAVCASLIGSPSPMLGTAIITKIECRPDVFDGSASPKLLLPLFYGLLLLKILL